MNLEYTITETTYRTHSGKIVKIDYEFDEYVEIASKSSSGLSQKYKEKLHRSNQWSITREQYQSIISKLRKPIIFDAFIDSLRPIIMGYYANDELEQAFVILDRDESGTLNIQEIGAMLSILNDSIDNNILLEYIQKVDENFNGELNYDEFRTLVLRGIGRDIICNNF